MFILHSNQVKREEHREMNISKYVNHMNHGLIVCVCCVHVCCIIREHSQLMCGVVVLGVIRVIVYGCGDVTFSIMLDPPTDLRFSSVSQFLSCQCVCRVSVSCRVSSIDLFVLFFVLRASGYGNALDITLRGDGQNVLRQFAVVAAVVVVVVGVVERTRSNAVEFPSVTSCRRRSREICVMLSLVRAHLPKLVSRSKSAVCLSHKPLVLLRVGDGRRLGQIGSAGLP